MLDLEEPELVDEHFEKEEGNSTISERQKRQAEFPGAPEQDNSKFVLILSPRTFDLISDAGLTCASPRWR